MNGSRLFGIQRGVKQGDVISPMLFNAGIEIAFRRWKQRLTQHGILLKSNMPRITNARYADDIMIFAKTQEELSSMVEMLIEELASIGLHVNGKKTTIMTNVSPSYNYLDISGEVVTVLGNNETHRYLGRLLCGDLSDRAATEIKNRLQNSLYKFSQHSRTLTNRNLSIKLRLKLFDSVITPSILFGLAALPVTQAHLDKVDVTQRKMIRKMLGGSEIQASLGTSRCNE